MNLEFIEVYENAFSDQYCDDAISLFEELSSLGLTWSRKKSEGIKNTLKDDESLGLNDIVSRREELVAGDERSIPVDKMIGKISNNFIPTLQNCLDSYTDKYSALNDFGMLTTYSNKMQRTDVGQGYHMWHCEQGNRESSSRILAYLVYLNDVDDGGETEFLYQHIRVKPKKGTVVIFPAGFTHTHRGNPPLSNTKYVFTGWLELQ